MLCITPTLNARGKFGFCEWAARLRRMCGRRPREARVLRTFGAGRVDMQAIAVIFLSKYVDFIAFVWSYFWVGTLYSRKNNPINNQLKKDKIKLMHKTGSLIACLSVATRSSPPPPSSTPAPLFQIFLSTGLDLFRFSTAYIREERLGTSFSFLYLFPFLGETQEKKWC